MAQTTEEFMAHYGVLGMKWGVRKDGRPRVTKREQKSRNQRLNAKKNRRSISNKDLESMIARLEKERKLKSLVSEDLSPGRTMVANILKNSGTKVAGTVAAGGLMYLVRGVLTKQWSLSELASNIPKLKK